MLVWGAEIRVFEEKLEKLGDLNEFFVDYFALTAFPWMFRFLKAFEPLFQILVRCSPWSLRQASICTKGRLLGLSSGHAGDSRIWKAYDSQRFQELFYSLQSVLFSIRDPFSNLTKTYYSLLSTA